MESTGIGVVRVAGAGTMGSGIAQVFEHSGYLVHLADVRQDVLDRGTRLL
jgi:3-hydroxyacyl-CoA dehydrogenase